MKTPVEEIPQTEQPVRRPWVTPTVIVSERAGLTAKTYNSNEFTSTNTLIGPS